MTPKPTKNNVVLAKVNGKYTDVLLDGGADLRVEPQSLMPENAYTGEVVQLYSSLTTSLVGPHKVTL